MPPPGFLPRLREITRRHGILLIADEVQTGFGRTGELFAVRHWDVEPDILVFAKGIASGLPLSGIIARAELLAAWRPGSPRRHLRRQRRVACAAANATLDVIEDEGLVANARERGAQLARPGCARSRRATRPSATSAASAAWSRWSSSSRARATDGSRTPTLAKRVIAEALDRKLIVLSAGPTPT